MVEPESRRSNKSPPIDINANNGLISYVCHTVMVYKREWQIKQHSEC